jgi:hypothetical protein
MNMVSSKIANPPIIAAGNIQFPIDCPRLRQPKQTAAFGQKAWAICNTPAISKAKSASDTARKNNCIFLRVLSIFSIYFLSIAPVGQPFQFLPLPLAQIPHWMHFVTSITAFPFCILIAPTGQFFTQRLQPIHFLLLT